MPDFLNACKVIQKVLFLCMFKEKPAAFPAGCPEEFSDYFVETYMDYWGNKFNVPEVPWTFASSP